MFSYRLLWPSVARRCPTGLLLIIEATCFALVTWGFWLERAKGIEPS